MSDKTKGIAAILAACGTWGFVPLYYKQIAHIPPLEILGHRTLWSVVIFAAVLLFQGRLGQILNALGSWRKMLLTLLAGLLISTNWFVFILSVQIGRVVEASLGYYLFPLVAVALGYLFLGEKLGRLQWVAVGLAGVAVALLSVGLGVAPWFSLILASTFGVYGLIKKSMAVGAVVSVTSEVLLLLPFALIWLWGVNFAGWTGVTGRGGGYYGRDLHDSLLLMFSGVLTAGPLILFSYATKRLSLATVGLLQYLNPTLQFSVAVLVFQEPFTGWHGIAFGLIWLALAIYSASAIRQEKSASRARIRSGTVDTSDM